jgi:hypothetical protein
MPMIRPKSAPPKNQAPSWAKLPKSDLSRPPNTSSSRRYGIRRSTSKPTASTACSRSSSRMKSVPVSVLWQFIASRIRPQKNRLKADFLPYKLRSDQRSAQPDNRGFFAALSAKNPQVQQAAGAFPTKSISRERPRKKVSDTSALPGRLANSVHALLSVRFKGLASKKRGTVY